MNSGWTVLTSESCLGYFPTSLPWERSRRRDKDMAGDGEEVSWKGHHRCWGEGFEVCDKVGRSEGP